MDDVSLKDIITWLSPVALAVIGFFLWKRQKRLEERITRDLESFRSALGVAAHAKRIDYEKTSDVVRRCHVLLVEATDAIQDQLNSVYWLQNPDVPTKDLEEAELDAAVKLQTAMRFVEDNAPDLPGETYRKVLSYLSTLHEYRDLLGKALKLAGGLEEMHTALDEVKDAFHKKITPKMEELTKHFRQLIKGDEQISWTPREEPATQSSQSEW